MKLAFFQICNFDLNSIFNRNTTYLNFLGHAYIARNNPQLIAGNFAGDSYKGNLDNLDLPEHIVKGIKLHRYIDDFTDHSEKILSAGHLFQEEGIRRISFIATDIIMDHFLAREWVNFSSKDYDQFIDKVYHYTDEYIELLDPEFQGLYKNLKLFGWFFDYPSVGGIRKILSQFSNRIPFENELVRCLDIYIEKQAEFDQLFASFLIDIKEDSVEFINRLG
jgi:acyl carrier protein phosphodiesterase